MAERDNTILLCDGVAIIGVQDACFTEGNWYGTYELRQHSDDPELAGRVSDYVEFCVLWNRRCKEDPDNPPDPSEFDEYADVINMQWKASPVGGGYTICIEDAPVFFDGQEVTWCAKVQG